MEQSLCIHVNSLWIRCFLKTVSECTISWKQSLSSPLAENSLRYRSYRFGWRITRPYREVWAVSEVGGWGENWAVPSSAVWWLVGPWGVQGAQWVTCKGCTAGGSAFFAVVALWLSVVFSDSWGLGVEGTQNVTRNCWNDHFDGQYHRRNAI